MKKRFAAVLSALVILFSYTIAETVLPPLGSVFGVDMPSLRHTVLKEPVSKETTEDGGVRLVFEGITEEDFTAFSKYLSVWGCVLADYQVEGSVLVATVAKDESRFTFSYDYKTLQAVVNYPSGTREEMVDVEALIALSADREERLKPYKTVGSYVSFGHYPQTAEGNDNTPIEWIVLDVDESKNAALLLSKHGMDAKPYNVDYTSITWEESTLRLWLNSEFLNRSFTEKEKSAILLSKIDNGKSQGYWVMDSGKDTQDQIFLLSYAEAYRYLGVTGSSNKQSRVSPTAYAKKAGARTDDSLTTVDGDITGWWWLRSPGDIQTLASGVTAAGSISRFNVSSGVGCVRPALWIDLGADIF